MAMKNTAVVYINSNLQQDFTDESFKSIADRFKKKLEKKKKR